MKDIRGLKADPRNPRSITLEAAKGLKSSLEEFGDLSGIVFNVRTKNLVCGHQRTKQLKEIYGDLQIETVKESKDGEEGEGIIIAPNGDKFRVRFVDWPLTRQRAANIVANSPAIAGTFTRDVKTLLKQIKVDDAELHSKLLLNKIEAEKKERIQKLKEDIQEDTQIKDLRPLPPPKLIWGIFSVPVDKFVQLAPLIEKLTENEHVNYETTAK